MCDAPFVGQVLFGIVIALVAAPFAGILIGMCFLMYRDFRDAFRGD